MSEVKKTISGWLSSVESGVDNPTYSCSGGVIGDPTFGDRTLFGQAIQSRFASDGFLAAGRAEKTWFTMSAKAKEAFLDHAVDEGHDGQSMLRMLQQMMDRLNKFLARSDIDDEQKLAMLGDLLGHVSDDYDQDGSDQAHRGLGSVLGEVLAGNVKNLFAGDDLELADLARITTQFGGKLSEWMEANEVAVKEDTSMKYLGELMTGSDAVRERRKAMSPAECAVDIRAELDVLRKRLEAKRRDDASSTEQELSP